MRFSWKMIVLAGSFFYFTHTFAGTSANIIPNNLPPVVLRPLAPANLPNTTAVSPNTALPATQQAPSVTGENPNSTVASPPQSTASKLSDAEMTTNIQAKIMGDSSLSTANVKVTTSSGMVTLEGSASSQAQINNAMNLARSVNGVKSVQSNIVVWQNSNQGTVEAH